MTSPSTGAATTSEAVATQQEAVTDQTNGDLFPIIQRLAEALPPGAGQMPVPELLLSLLASQPEVFRGVDRLTEAAKKVSGLREDLARQWKEKGNREFGAGQLQAAIVTYTHGLLCAEMDETVAVLLNNRSTAFFQVKRYADACMDAHHALHYKPSYWKALQRRGRALEELSFVAAGAKDTAAAEAESLVGANTLEEMQRILGEVASGQAEMALPPIATISAPLCVERSARGRGLVAKERLECGTVFEETPYALAPRTEVLLSVCSYCMQYTSCLYPGEAYRRAKTKSRGFFCSAECADRAWRYYGEAESNNVFFLCCPNDALLAARIVRGMKGFPEVAVHNISDDFDPVGHDHFGAQHIQTLEGSFSKELQPNAATGGYESIVAVLALYMEALSAAEAEQLRKAQRQILLNGVDLTCSLRVATDSNNDGPLAHANTVAYLGKAIYAVGSLLNHACDPNCYASFVGNPQGASPRLVVRAIRPIMEGEELTVAYGGIDIFHFHSMRNRLQTLRDRYGFICRCTACVNQVDEPVRADKEHYLKASDYYQKGRRMIREKNYETAITVLLQSYEIVMRYICPPPNPPQIMISKTHDALALAYFHTKNLPKCIEHLKAALDMDIFIHKTDNRVEMINNYSRLAFIVEDVAERKLYADKVAELIQRFYAPSSMRDLQIAYTESVCIRDGQGS